MDTLSFLARLLVGLPIALFLLGQVGRLSAAEPTAEGKRG